MVDSVRAAHLLSVIERRRTVTIGDDEDVRWREDLQGSFERCSDQSRRFVAWNHQTRICYVGLNLGVAGEVGRWRIFLEKYEKRCKCVAVSILA
jgi:hypothetical protein